MSFDVKIKQAFTHLRALVSDVQRHYAVLLWPAAGLVLAIAGWSTILLHMENEKKQAETAVLASAAALAQNYAERISRIVDSHDRTLRQVRYDWKISHGMTRLEETMAEGLFPEESIRMVMLLDIAGNPLTGTQLYRPDANFSDRQYFQVHRNSSADHLYIGLPMLGRATGEEIIPLSRRLENRNKAFSGVVMLASATRFYTANYSDVTFGKHGLLAMAGSDSLIRAARVGDKVFSQSTPALMMPFRIPGPQGTRLLKGEEWFPDRRNRYVAWQTVKNAPLVAIVGLDQAEALNDFYAAQAASLRAAWFNFFWLMLITLSGMIFSLLLARRKSQYDAVQTAYRIATEAGDNGFYINRPVYDRDGVVTDFLIVDSNHRGAQLFKLQRHELIGKRFSDFYSGRLLEDAIRRLCEALEKGSYETEIKVTNANRLSAEWIHYKAVRSGGDLSVTIRDISQSKAHIEELERRGNEDALTSLPNRHWIQHFLPKAIERAARHERTLALLFIDVDGFKAVNDAFGHAAGDELLRTIAKRLKTTIRPGDHVVRLGGDEFVILLENAGQRQDVRQVVERVLQAFVDRFHLENDTHALSASIGVSMYPADGNDAETLLKNADIAMYAVKTTTKHDYRFYEPYFYQNLRARLDSEIELRRAIETDQMLMVYQPRIDIRTGETVSVEALVRWNHPLRGIVSPVEFIPLAEETGMILALGALVVDKVCAQLALWRESGHALVPVSVNVSARQFNQSDILAVFRNAMARHGIAGALLEIEITETSMMQEHVTLTTALQGLRAMGIKLAIDDFGTGYSSLSQLQKLDFDVLKVDRSFTAEIDCREGKIFITAIVTMAHALGMRVVAEGVETDTQLAILHAIGCDEAQGYLLSRPVLPGERPPVVRRHDELMSVERLG